MTQGTCIIPGCGRLMVIRDPGYCLMHYKRWRRRGSAHDITPEERFFASVAQVGECWAWCGSAGAGGYGTFTVKRRNILAHRWAYEFLRAEIPDGLHLDHLCVNPPCVNPWHLEPVTPRENLHRSRNHIGVNARKTHCLRGHEFTHENTYVDKRGRRGCRRCMQIRAEKYQM